jgi:hypothetical protein
VTVEDPSERVLPDIGLVRLVDPETGATLDVDTSNPVVRKAFDVRVADEASKRRHLLRRLAIDEIPVATDKGTMEPLLRFFRQRETRIRCDDSATWPGARLRAHGGSATRPCNDDGSVTVHGPRATDPRQSGGHDRAGQRAHR